MAGFGVLPLGTKGTIIERYDHPEEGYAVDVALPNDTQPSGYFYDNVVLKRDQFRVVNEEPPSSVERPG